MNGSSRPPLWTRVIPWIAFACAAGSFACNGCNAQTPTDAGVDAASVPPDASALPLDAGVDSGVAQDSGIDGGSPMPDAGLDAGSDAGADAGTDAGSMLDAGCNPAPGYALVFDPVTQPVVVVPDTQLLHLTSGMTVEAWILVTTQGNNCILCKPFGTGTGDSIAVWFQGAGTLYWGMNLSNTSGAVTAPWTLANGTWHHIAATYDGTAQTQTLYIDGVLAGSAANLQGAPSFDGQPFLIGADVNNGALSFNFAGNIDEVRIFSAARTAAQVSADFAACSPINDPTLVAYYPFDEGSGLIAHDLSPNHLDATLGWPDAGGAAPLWTVSTAPF
jgi:hypothetical protein